MPGSGGRLVAIVIAVGVDVAAKVLPECRAHRVDWALTEPTSKTEWGVGSPERFRRGSGDEDEGDDGRQGKAWSLM